MPNRHSEKSSKTVFVHFEDDHI